MKTKTNITSLIINIAFGVLAVISLYFAFSGKDLDELGRQLQKADYFWMIPVVCSSLLGSAARALRWQLLLEPVAHKPTFRQSFFSLMYGYFVNIGTPRVGEVSRCVSLNKMAGIPFSKSFGTVFTERAVDMVCLLICVFLAFALQVDLLGSFFNENIYTPINEKTGNNAATIFFVLLLVALAGLVVLLLASKGIRRLTPKNKILLFIKEIIEGFISIFRLKKPVLFLFYTMLIWFSYFLTSYLWFFAFDATQNLTAAVAFTVMSVGAIAKSLPIQAGGAGVYHALINQLLVLYHIGGVDALSYATLNHGTQLVYNIVLGIAALAWMYYTPGKMQLKT